MPQDSAILQNLKLYGVYNIRYSRLVGHAEKTMSPRALFLGEFSKNKLGASKFIPQESSDQESASSRYIGIGFLVYLPRISATESHDPTSGSFEVIICDPVKGLSKAEEDNMITLSPGYYHITAITYGTTDESRKAFEKVYTIATKTGLIDMALHKVGTTNGQNPLSKTVVRSIHKGLTEIISVVP